MKSKHSSRNRFILLFLLLFGLFAMAGTLQVSAQSTDNEVSSRELMVSYHDSLARARVKLMKPKKRQRNIRKMYYWCYANNIVCNQGTYNENPLHGEYFVFNRDKRLITRGYFQNGKKHRKWVYWYGDGTLRRTERWWWGYQCGRTMEYDQKGGVVAKLRYRWNHLQGKQRMMVANEFVVVRYKKGVQVVPKVKKQKGKKVSNEPIFNENKNRQQPIKPKKHWWQKKDKQANTTQSTPGENKTNPENGQKKKHWWQKNEGKK